MYIYIGFHVGVSNWLWGRPVWQWSRWCRHRRWRMAKNEGAEQQQRLVYLSLEYIDSRIPEDDGRKRGGDIPPTRVGGSSGREIMNRSGAPRHLRGFRPTSGARVGIIAKLPKRHSAYHISKWWLYGITCSAGLEDWNMFNSGLGGNTEWSMGEMYGQEM